MSSARITGKVVVYFRADAKNNFLTREGRLLKFFNLILRPWTERTVKLGAVSGSIDIMFALGTKRGGGNELCAARGKLAVYTERTTDIKMRDRRRARRRCKRVDRRRRRIRGERGN